MRESDRRKSPAGSGERPGRVLGGSSSEILDNICSTKSLRHFQGRQVPLAISNCHDFSI